MRTVIITKPSASPVPQAGEVGAQDGLRLHLESGWADDPNPSLQAVHRHLLAIQAIVET
ncbi:hypothetical protein ACWEQL_08435 [Kitasatospora sp. NPDC004240]